MESDLHPSNLPLPRTWPELAKHAVLGALGGVRLLMASVYDGYLSGGLPQARLVAELDAARTDAALLREQARILRARFDAIPAQRRPHYPPVERMAILALRTRRGWSAKETANAFGITEQTVNNWMRRLDEGGEDALVAMPVPVNRFPAVVSEIVRHLWKDAPRACARKVAEILARAGVSIAEATVRRMRAHVARSTSPEGGGAASGSGDGAAAPNEAKAKRRTADAKPVRARYAHHVWHLDMTLFPLIPPWVPWWPFSLMPFFPFAVWMVAVVDHYSRDVVGWRLHWAEPRVPDVIRTLDQAVRFAGRAPKYIVSDQGAQFQNEYRAWCAKRGVVPRYGAIGQHGAIAIIERFWLTLKTELWRGVLERAQPMTLRTARVEIAAWVAWYRSHRPHRSLGGRTPEEVRLGLVPAVELPRVEVRPKYPLPRGKPRDGPKTRRLPKGAALAVVAFEGRPYLPVVELRHAA